MAGKQGEWLAKTTDEKIAIERIADINGTAKMLRDFVKETEAAPFCVKCKKNKAEGACAGMCLPCFQVARTSHPDIDK